MIVRVKLDLAEEVGQKYVIAIAFNTYDNKRFQGMLYDYIILVFTIHAHITKCEEKK